MTDWYLIFSGSMATVGMMLMLVHSQGDWPNRSFICGFIVWINALAFTVVHLLQCQR